MPRKPATTTSAAPSDRAAGGSAASTAELQAALDEARRLIRRQRQELRDLREAAAAKPCDGDGALAEAQSLTHLGSWQWDVASGNISWSDELYRIYGLKPQGRAIGFEEFMGMIHADDRSRVHDIIGGAMQSGQPFDFEHRIVQPDDTVRVLHGKGKVVTGPDGKLLRMIGTSQDITERKAAELALCKRDERFSAVTNATHDLVYDLDVATDRVWFNEVLQSDYGYAATRRERTRGWWARRIHPDDLPRVHQEFDSFLRGDRQTWSIEYRFRKADGSYAYIRNRAFVLRDFDGKPERVIGTFLDITEAKRLDRAKDDFISLVSHQLRTPLTVIRMYGSMLSDGMAGPLDEAQQGYADNITSASVRLIKLVSDILNISRLELNRIRIEPVPTDVNAVIHQHLQELSPLASEKRITIDFQPSPSLEPVAADVTILGEILHNLVGNAVRYAPSAGGQVAISFDRRADGYLLTVRDNGIGIPRRAHPHVFDRFYRADNAAKVDGDGTGLGLYLVKLFTEAVGGEVWFDSSEGEGTSFYVRFPAEGMQPIRPA